MLEFKGNTRRSLLWDVRGKSSLAKSIMPQQVIYTRPQTSLCTVLSRASCPPICVGPTCLALGAALTHVQLPDKAGHVVVLEILGQHLLGKAALVEHMEAGAILQRRQGQKQSQGESLTTRGAQEEPYSRGSLVL